MGGAGSPRATVGTFYCDSDSRGELTEFCKEHLTLLNRVGAPSLRFHGPVGCGPENLPPHLIFSVANEKNEKFGIVLERSWLETREARRAFAGMLVVFLDREPFKPPLQPLFQFPALRHLPEKPGPEKQIKHLISNVSNTVARLRSSNSVISLLAACQAHIALVPIEDPAWDSRQLKTFLDENVKPRVERFCPEFLPLYEKRAALPPIMNLEEEYRKHLQSPDCPFTWDEEHDHQTDEGRRLEAAINLHEAKSFRWGLVYFLFQVMDQLEMVGKGEPGRGTAAGLAEQDGGPRPGTPSMLPPAGQGDVEGLDDAYHKGARCFRCLGHGWLLVYEGVTKVVRSSKGMVYIAQLLANPGQEIHAAMLRALAAGENAVPMLGSAGPVLTSTTLENYRERMRAIREERDDAHTNNDLATLERLDREQEALEDEVSRATGLHGAARDAVSDRERARQAVAKAIERSLRVIEKQHQPLGKHLRAYLDMGEFLSYRPETDIRWIV